MKHRTVTVALLLLAVCIASAILLTGCNHTAVPSQTPEPFAASEGSTPTEASATEDILSTEGTDIPETTGKPMQPEEQTLKLMINGTPVSVKWEDNESVAALTELVKNEPLTMRMSMYGGFEQVGPIGQSLPRNDTQTTTAPGDIVLYSGNKIVVFYGSNSWAYTRLGRITGLDAAELSSLLGNGDVALTLYFE